MVHDMVEPVTLPNDSGDSSARGDEGGCSGTGPDPLKRYVGLERMHNLEVSTIPRHLVPRLGPRHHWHRAQPLHHPPRVHTPFSLNVDLPVRREAMYGTGNMLGTTKYSLYSCTGPLYW